VEFIKKLRDEVRFESFELLQRQILKDAEEARGYFLER
jgi:FAD synthase